MPQGADAGSVHPIGPGRQIGYAFIGLLAGNGAMAAYWLIAYFRALVHSLPSHNLPIADSLWNCLLMILGDGVCSLLGWLIVGLPAVFLLPLRMIQRLPWLLILLIAAAIGVAALFIIFFLFSRSHPTSDYFSFQRAGPYWILALLASMVGFPTYCWLIRRRSA